MFNVISPVIGSAHDDRSFRDARGLWGGVDGDGGREDVGGRVSGSEWSGKRTPAELQIPLSKPGELKYIERCLLLEVIVRKLPIFGRPR